MSQLLEQEKGKTGIHTCQERQTMSKSIIFDICHQSCCYLFVDLKKTLKIIRAAKVVENK